MKCSITRGLSRVTIVLGEFSEISPLITELLSASDDAASEFSIRALDMTDDIVNSITLARCKLLYPG